MKMTCPSFLGFNNDFVTAELLDLNLDVRPLFVRDPGSFLTWRCSSNTLLEDD